MKRFSISILLFLAVLNLCAQTPVLRTQADTINYYIGMLEGSRMGESIRGQKEIMPTVATDYELIKAGVQLGLDGKVTLTEEELLKYLQSSFETLQAKQAETKQAEEQAFLTQNGKRKGVKTTTSGLQYEVLKAVKTKNPVHPTDTSNVKVHYEGKLLDGTIFDSSYQRGEPISFPLNGVIKGWTEGVQLMTVGEKYRFFIPYKLGYGERGAGEHIPPYATLVFDIELLEIK